MFYFSVMTSRTDQNKTFILNFYDKCNRIMPIDCFKDPGFYVGECHYAKISAFCITLHICQKTEPRTPAAVEEGTCHIEATERSR